MQKLKKLYSIIFAKKSLRKKINYLKSELSYFLNQVQLNHYPVRMTIDPCNICNLQCVLCPSGKKSQGRTFARMPFETFKNIIDKSGKYLWKIDLFNWGEPFLNKEIFKMVAYAKQYDIDVTISSNLNHFNDDICEKVISSGLDKLIISLDGASQESVSKYQINSNFNTVISNIKQLVKKKQQLKSALPFIQWRFLVNKYNEQELELANRMTKEIGIDYLEIGTFRCDMGQELFCTSEEQYKSVAEFLPVDPNLSMYSYERNERKILRQKCKMLWQEMTINPNGSISPCCALWYEKFDFAQLKDGDIKTIWNNNMFLTARKIILDIVKEQGHICQICKDNKAIL